MNETSPPFTESELVNLLSSWANNETSSYLTEQYLSDPEIDPEISTQDTEFYTLNSVS